MKTVAIICEYNPFHLGHAYHIESIKRQFGDDTAIIAIMSGNFVERGDLAVLGKFDRAEMAVRSGASLVLELPFPYSMASAEYFAFAAVEIADKLGCVDFLSFGSECGDISRLEAAADRVSSPAFDSAVEQLSKSKELSSLGYAALRTQAYRSLYGDEDTSLLSSPNNILAVEYLKALARLSSRIEPHTIRRTGTDLDASGDTVPFAGATHIRSLIVEDKISEALASIPDTAHDTLLRALHDGRMPVRLEKLSSAILASLRLEKSCEAAECGGGLYEYLKKKARQSTDLADFFHKSATKKFTDARIRRATLFSYFGVTPAMLHDRVRYTQVLAMDGKGQAVLHHIRKHAGISILTKPADTDKLPPEAKAQAEASYRADSVYTLAYPKPQAADVFLRTSPYRK